MWVGIPAEHRYFIVVDPLDNDVNADVLGRLTLQLVCFGE